MIRKYLKNVIKSFLHQLKPDIDMKNIVSNTQILQSQLLLHYQYLRNNNLNLPDLSDTGFRVYSQLDEDGLIHYIFSLIGTTTRRCIDIGFSGPYGSNTANLICNNGWMGLLIEGRKDGVENSKKYFETNKDTQLYPPTIVHQWVTRNNINGIIENNGFLGEIDFLSIDLDGVDYWIWKSLEVVKPNLIVVEYQDIWGPEKSVTVPYKDNFDRYDFHPDFCGASIMAFIKLGRKKGYRLIGCNRMGYNGFFLRDDIGGQYFPEVKAEDVLQHPWNQYGYQNRLPNVKDMAWEEV